MIARKILGFLTALLLLLTPVSLLSKTPMNSPETFPDTDSTEAVHPDNVSEDRRQFASDVFSHLDRKLQSRFQITLRQPRNRLNHPPNPDRFSDSRSGNVLYGYYLPQGTNPYGSFVGCSKPDPDYCETLDLTQWQNSSDRFRFSADRISDRIIKALYGEGSQEETGSSYDLLSMFGLSSSSDSRTIKVHLANPSRTSVSDTATETPVHDDPRGQPAVFSNSPDTVTATDNLRSTSMRHEAAIHEIILLISNEKFLAAKQRLDRLGPEIRYHPRLKNLVKQLKQLTRLTTDGPGN